MSSGSDSNAGNYRKRKRHRSRSRSPQERRKGHHRGESHHHHRRDHSPDDHVNYIAKSIKQEPLDDDGDGRRRERRREHKTRRDAIHSHNHRVSVKQERDERKRNDERRVENHRQRRRGNPFEQEPEAEFGEADVEEEKADKEKPDFELSGKLTEDTNTFRGVVIKYNEPPEARKPKKRWRLYPFKGEEALPVWHIHRQSAYMLGRDRKIADLPIDHPSCSKQHAVFQYRLVDFERADGTMGRRITPYIIDLGSANGTYVNNQRIDAQHYVELFEKDVLKFGFSSREYVLMHETMNTAEEDDEDGAESPQ